MTQREDLIDYLIRERLAQAAELRAIGVSGAAISRAVEDGEIDRVGRGLYQIPDAETDLNINFIEMAKRSPKAVRRAHRSGGCDWRGEDHVSLSGGSDGQWLKRPPISPHPSASGC